MSQNVVQKCRRSEEKFIHCPTKQNSEKTINRNRPRNGTEDRINRQGHQNSYNKYAMYVQEDRRKHELVKKRQGKKRPTLIL